MGITATTLLDFGALAPGRSASASLMTFDAPSDAQVSLGIGGPDPSFFRVTKMTSFDWVFEDVPPSEGPPGGFKGHPKQRVLEIANQTDGSRPMSVSKGQPVQVEVEALAPVVLADKIAVLASLFIDGDTWGDPAVVTLKMLYAHVDIVPATLSVAVGSVQQSPLDFTLTSVTGGGTSVVFEPANWTTDASIQVSGDTQPTVGPDHTPKHMRLNLLNDGTKGSGFFHLAASAFGGKQRELFVIQID